MSQVGSRNRHPKTTFIRGGGGTFIDGETRADRAASIAASPNPAPAGVSLTIEQPVSCPSSSTVQLSLTRASVMPSGKGPSGSRGIGGCAQVGLVMTSGTGAEVWTGATGRSGATAGRAATSGALASPTGVAGLWFTRLLPINILKCCELWTC